MFRNQLLGLFLDKTQAAEAIAIGSKYLTIVCVAYIVAAVMRTYLNVLRGAGDVNTSAVAGILELIGRIIFAYILVRPLGSTGIWIATPLAWAMGASVPLSDTIRVSGLIKVGRVQSLSTKCRQALFNFLSTLMSQRSYRRLLRHGFFDCVFDYGLCHFVHSVKRHFYFFFQPICTDSTKSCFAYSVRHHYYYIAVIKAFGLSPVPLYQAAYRQATIQKTPFQHSGP